MKKFIKEYRLMINGFNAFSKTVFRYGNTVIFSLIFISLFYYIFKGLIVGYYEGIEISSSLLECAGQCTGIIYTTVIISEIAESKK